MKELHLAATEWIVLDSLPFNMLQGEGFKRFIKKIDPKFRIPNNKTIKNIIADKYSIQKTKIKKLINDTCVTATITTDLWTSRSKEGYIGVTCHWLSPNFEPIDILLAIERMTYPHTNEIILNYLKNLVEEFELSNKIICGVTDNGSNMQKAFDIWEGVERLPCTAHTLQLSINKALITIKWDLLEKILTFICASFLELISSDDETDIDSNSDDEQEENPQSSNPPPRPNLDNVAITFQQKIYESLFDYWDQTSNIGLLATLLDPRLKKMVLFDCEARTSTIEKLNDLYLELKYIEEQDNHSSSSTLSSQVTKVSPFFESIFGNINNEESEFSEVDRYLDVRLTPVAQPNENPWTWWNMRRTEFSILSKLANKYLSIPATSVPSERLFSDAGNQITSKRTRLSSEIVNKILFLKRNDFYCK
jgi:hypothetical protein